MVALRRLVMRIARFYRERERKPESGDEKVPLCTFVSFVVDEVQMPRPQRTRRFTKDVDLDRSQLWG